MLPWTNAAPPTPQAAPLDRRRLPHHLPPARHGHMVQLHGPGRAAGRHKQRAPRWVGVGGEICGLRMVGGTAGGKSLARSCNLRSSAIQSKANVRAWWVSRVTTARRMQGYCVYLDWSCKLPVPFWSARSVVLRRERPRLPYRRVAGGARRGARRHRGCRTGRHAAQRPLRHGRGTGPYGNNKCVEVEEVEEEST